MELLELGVSALVGAVASYLFGTWKLRNRLILLESSFYSHIQSDNAKKRGKGGNLWLSVLGGLFSGKPLNDVIAETAKDNPDMVSEVVQNFLNKKEGSQEKQQGPTGASGWM